jgi:hypothetical protein
VAELFPISFAYLAWKKTRAGAGDRDLALKRLDRAFGKWNFRDSLLTVLKKLDLQRGSARKENALFRGLDHHSCRLVPEVLNLLQHEGLALLYRRTGVEMPIWTAKFGITPDKSALVRWSEGVGIGPYCRLAVPVRQWLSGRR